MLADLFCDGEEEWDSGGHGNALMNERAKRIPKPPPPRAPCAFVGLENQGATCYLNSLLQCLYLTPELRKGLFSIDPIELGVEQLEVETVKDDGEVKESEVVQKKVERVDEDEPDEAVMEQLISMGFTRPCSFRCILAIQKKGNHVQSDLFSAALEYALEHSEDDGINDPLPSESVEDVEVGDDCKINGKIKKKKPRMIPLELQRLFSQLQVPGKGVDRRAVSTHELTERGFRWTGMDGSVQHDAHELNRLLIDALEKSLKRTSAENLCSSLYRGLLANQIECLTCHMISERREPYYDLLLQVLGAGDMARALGAYITPELLDGDNRYECDTCKCRRDSHRRVVLKTIPPVLTFSCQRFDIDRTTWERVKVTHEFRFPLLFSMSEFTAHGGEFKECSDLPSEQDGQKKTFFWLDEAIEAAQRISRSLKLTYGDKAGDILKDQLADPQMCKSLQKEMGCHNFFSCDQEHVYQLFAVIIHHGSAYSGHYTAYIRDVKGEGLWELPTDDELFTPTSEDSNIALPTNLCHILQKRCGKNNDEASSDKDMFFVLENSPLHIILTIVSSSNAAEQVSGVSLHDLSTSITSNLGNKTWDSVYRSEYGTLKNFLEYYDTFFEITQTGKTNKIHIAVRGSICYKVLSFERFRKASLSHSKVELNAYCPNSKSTAEVKHCANPQPSDSKDEWQSGGRKKKRKKRKKNQIGNEVDHVATVKHSNSKGSSSDSEAKLCTDDKNDEEANSKAEEIIAHKLLSHIYGPFFNFNDSLVTPISLAELKSAYEGSKSAYMLVYRDIKLGKCFSGEKDEEKVTSTHNALVNDQIALTAPPYWQAKVNTMNEKLQIARQDYETSLQSISINVLTPSHFSSRWPVLARKSTKDTEELLLLPAGGLKISFDSRKTVDDLKIDVLQSLHDLQKDTASSVSLLSEALQTSSESDVANLHLSCLRCCSQEGGPGFMYIEASLPGDAQVGDLLTDQAELLLWSSLKGAHDLDYEVYSRPPKPTRVTYVKNNTISSEEIWFPVSRTVENLCGYVADTVLGISLDNPSLRIDSLVETELQEIEYGKTEKWEARALFLNGCWQKIQVHGQCKKNFWNDVSMGDFDGKEICFDWDDASREVRVRHGSLALEEVHRRNNMWTMHVKYEDERKTGRSLRDIVEEIGKGTSQCLASDREFTESGVISDVSVDNEKLSSKLPSDFLFVDIDCDDTLLMLKQKVFQRLLQLSSHFVGAKRVEMKMIAKSRLFHRLNFRTGHNLDVGLLENEDYSIKELSLCHNATIRLQLSDFVKGDHKQCTETRNLCTIRFCVVTGNDSVGTAAARAGKHNPQQPGTRSLILALTLNDMDETLHDMKQRALIQYYSVVTVAEENMTKTRRMRKTNWADECLNELLFEVARTKVIKRDDETGENKSNVVPLTVGSALSNGDLKENCLILIEEGALPDRDSLLINLYIWPSPDALPPPPSVPVFQLNQDKSAPLKEEFQKLVLEGGGISEGSEMGSGIKHPDMQAKLDWLPRLPSVKCCRHGNVKDLYEACYEALVNYHEENYKESESESDGSDVCSLPFILPPSPEYMLLRNLDTATCLPGKVYNLPLSGKGLSISGSGSIDNTMAMMGRPSGIGKKNKKSKGTVNAQGRTLQKMGFREEGNSLIIQILDSPQCAPTPGQFRLWAQLAETSMCSSGLLSPLCAWPPREVNICGGLTPSFGHLLRPLRSAFNLPEAGPNNSILIYKHVPETFTWKLLSPGLNKVNKKGTENLVNAPYSLKDGSFLVLLQQNGGRGEGVDRLEDMFIRYVREILAEERKIRRAHGREVMFVEEKGEGGRSRRKESENILKIGDFDMNFSSDDDDGE